MSDPAVWKSFSCTIPFSLLFFPRKMRVTFSVCHTNQRLTDSQPKVCWVKRWPAAPVLKVNKFRFVHTFTFLLVKPVVWNAHKSKVAVSCCIEPQFSFHLSFWSFYASMEREQETAWVCRQTGQQSWDKEKETQMEVLRLKLRCIPKTLKTNIHFHRR